MAERFVDFTSYIGQAYKTILKIKAYKMQAYGLKAAHVMCLYFLGRQPQALTPGQLARLCAEDKAGISKALAELKARGLITVDPSSEAKVYKQAYRLTAAGAAIQAEIDGFIEQSLAAGGQGLSEEERRVLYRALGLVVDNLNRYYQQLLTQADDGKQPAPKEE